MIATLLLVGALIYGSTEDIRTKKIPDRVHLLIILSGMVSIFLYKTSWQIRVIGTLAIGITVLLIAVNMKAFGGGDVKLCAAIAFSLGLFPALYALLIAFLMASLYLLLCKFYRRSEVPIALAPYITVGTLIVLLVQRINPSIIITL